MTREELINSDEYIAVNVECIVVSNKSVKKMREELNKFFLDLKAELLSSMQPNSDTPPQLNKHDVSGLSEQLPCSHKFKQFTKGWLICTECDECVEVGGNCH